MDGLFNNISDIFGNSIMDNSTPYILIHGNEIRELLKPVYKNSKFTIWTYNENVIKKNS